MVFLTLVMTWLVYHGIIGICCAIALFIDLDQTYSKIVPSYLIKSKNSLGKLGLQRNLLWDFYDEKHNGVHKKVY